MERTKIIRVARSWLGTPYHHQASVKGVGADCLGLVRGVYRELYGVDYRPPNYSRDWGDVNGAETLYAAGCKYLTLNTEPFKPGDVIGLRWRENRVMKHIMIVTEENRAIHSYEKSGVVESYLDHWRPMIAASFKFPGVK